MSDDLRDRIIPASVEAAEDAIDNFLGGPLQVKKHEQKYLRFMPAYTVRDGRGIWFSVVNRHYSVPLTRSKSGDGQTWTYDCPQSIGARCITCENKALFQQMGVWGDNNKRGCRPSRRIRFNVIDAEHPDKGVLVFEDGTTTLKMLRTILKSQDSKIMDPHVGSVMVVQNLGEDPWRAIWKAEGNPVSLDELHPDAMSWALPDNLPNLDKSWNIPTYDEQLAKFTGIDPDERALPVRGEQASLPPADLPEDDVLDAEEVPSEPEKPKPQRAWEKPSQPAEQAPKPTSSTGNSGLLSQFQKEIDAAEEEEDS